MYSAGRLANDLGDRPEGDPFAVRGDSAREVHATASASRTPASATSRDLPTPGSPTMVTSRQRLSAYCLLECCVEDLKLPARGRRAAPLPVSAPARRRCRAGGTPRAARLFLLSVDRWARLGLDRAANQTVRQLADEHLAGRRCLTLALAATFTASAGRERFSPPPRVRPLAFSDAPIRARSSRSEAPLELWGQLLHSAAAFPGPHGRLGARRPRAPQERRRPPSLRLRRTSRLSRRAARSPPVISWK